MPERVEQILNILGNGGRAGVPLTELPPGRVEELCRELIFEYDVELVDKDVCTLTFLPVKSDSVKHSVRYDKKSRGLKLAA